jgi:hypothetical protein
MLTLPSAFAPMANYRQFIVYTVVASATRPGKTDKFPVCFRTGRVKVNAHDAQYQTDFTTASTMAAGMGADFGVGFVFTDADPFWFMDLDGCHTGVDWNDTAKYFCNLFAGAAIEVSTSGKGLHIFGTGQVIPHNTRYGALGLEFYHTGRFVALTGSGAVGDAGKDFTSILPGMLSAYFPPSGVGEISFTDWTTEPCAEWNGSVDDAEILRRAMRSNSLGSAFGNRASFADLYDCNVTALSVAYPDSTGVNAFNASSADAALAQHLAFWTGKDCARIERMMRNSALLRSKWDSRDDYLPTTIIKACAMQTSVLTDATIRPALPDVAVEGAPRSRKITPEVFLNNEQQIMIFEGCTYITDAHQVLIPGGHLLKPEQFNVKFGGRSWNIDESASKSTRVAFEAFTQNVALRCPIAESTTFRPDLTPGIITAEGLANTYWPIEIATKQGDASRFTDHLHKLFPNSNDYKQILSYMAAVVQHKGIKFQYAPIIQGVEGNGKTLLSRVVAYAVGQRYAHSPKASDVANKFNAWQEGKIFISIEDIYVPHGAGEVMEELKPMITSYEQEIQGKGKDQKTRRVCCNYLINSNHKDMLKRSKNDRRFPIYYTPQQTKQDLIDCGWCGDYFPNLYTWLRTEGYAIVADLLMHYPIEDSFNPALGHVAPTTSSEIEVVERNIGQIESEILEACAAGEPGFMNGWISSAALDHFLRARRFESRLPLNKRRDVLESLGYIRHPALGKTGRVNNNVLPDGAKPILYLKQGHFALFLESPVEVERAYSAAQISFQTVI